MSRRTGWADDWTAALERPYRNATTAVPQATRPDSEAWSNASDSSAPFNSTDAPGAAGPGGSEVDGIPSPPRMHYCSEREREDWEAALGCRGAEDAEHVASEPVQSLQNAAPPARPALLVAIELGSHSTRAVLHDGRSELARLSYDTMLGQQAVQPREDGGASGSSSGGGRDRRDKGIDLHPDAVDRTLVALRRIMDAAAAAAAGLESGACAAEAVLAAEAAAEADGPMWRDDIGAYGQSVHDQVRSQAAEPLATAAGQSGQQSDGTAAVAGGGAAARSAALQADIRTAPHACRVPRLCRMVATAAVRGASEASRGALAAAAAALAGCPLEVLSGEEEGRLAWRGVVGGLRGVGAVPQDSATTTEEPPAGDGGAALPPQLLVVDMGGRSTEFIHGDCSGLQPPAAVSVPLGCVGLHADALRASAELASARARDCPGGPPGQAFAASGQCGEASPPSLEALAACGRLAEQAVREHCGGEPWLPARASSCTTSTASAAQAPRPAPRAATVVFTGGTATTLAALHMSLPRYERTRVHGSLLDAGDIRKLMAALTDPGGGAAALASYDWLSEARCRTLAAGCAGLLGVMAALGLERVRVSDADLLDGLLDEVLQAWRVERGAGPAV